jgi:hypothetical protein
MGIGSTLGVMKDYQEGRTEFPWRATLRGQEFYQSFRESAYPSAQHIHTVVVVPKLNVEG